MIAIFPQTLHRKAQLDDAFSQIFRTDCEEDIMDFGLFHSGLNSSTGSENDSVWWYQCSSMFFVFFVSELFNTCLGLITNIWMEVVILRDWRNQAVQEIFTVNLGMLEILYCLLSQVLLLNYVVMKISFINKYNWFVYGLGFFGRSLFQCGMSVERYLAVVHPVFFYKYHFFKCKVSFLIVGWLVTVVITLFVIENPTITQIVSHFMVLVSINLFCTLQILRVLKRPSPGAGAGKKVKEVNLKKKRACYTVMINQATLIFNYIPLFIIPTLQAHVDQYTLTCVYEPLGLSCCLMGSFLQPLIFLHRSGTLHRPGRKEPARK